MKADTRLGGIVNMKAGETSFVRIFVTGSIEYSEEVVSNLQKAELNLQDMFAAKRQRFRNIDATAKIEIPDGQLQTAYEWGKYCTDWLVRDVPGLGRGVSAGLPDYPWFFSNDQSATFNAIAGTLSPDIMKESMYMLLSHSNKYTGNTGSIFHEMSTNGQVYAGNRMDESQGFIHAAYNLWLWTGDKQFLQDMYRQALKIDTFLTVNDKNKNFIPEGYGGVEIEGLDGEMFDVACQTAEFFRDMSAMSEELGYSSVARTYRKKAQILTDRINKKWWNRENDCFYDIVTDTASASSLVAYALKNFTDPRRNKWAIDYLDRLRQRIKDAKSDANGYTIFFNPSLPALATEVADDDKARAYINSSKWFCNKFGLYISGISRPDDIHSEEVSVAERLKGEEFNYRQAVMPGNTSQLAIAACKYENADSAMFFVKKLLNNFSYATPGTTYEVSPDYGQFVQAWNVCGINIPIIRHFFGINPNAAHRIVEINPNMPSTWNEASIRDVLIGNNSFGMPFRKCDGVRRLDFMSKEKGWKVVFMLPERAENVKVNGQPARLKDNKVVIENIDGICKLEYSQR